ncbi:PREDICTED: splicing factor 3A subunit 2-like [Cercocebus atys]|uniref:splicing factor 3A subunit 2-like n=1 Tax=Cercocebus atys TaxID=9531 RepID=UPI0005F36BD8|nr:PREDICTED: splicing factor 3A subunit 2-like [Cercocebus atys]
MPARSLLHPPIPGRGPFPPTARRPLPPARLACRWSGVRGARLPGSCGEGHPGVPLAVPGCAHPHAPAPILLPRTGLGRGTSGGPLPGQLGGFSRCAAWNPHTHLPGRKVPLLPGKFPAFQHPGQQQRCPGRRSPPAPCSRPVAGCVFFCPGFLSPARRRVPQTQPPTEEPARTGSTFPKARRRGLPGQGPARPARAPCKFPLLC